MTYAGFVACLVPYRANTSLKHSCVRIYRLKTKFNTVLAEYHDSGDIEGYR